MSGESDMSDLAYQGEDALQHYGVKGMKWGVRKKNTSSSSGSSKSSTGGIKERLSNLSTGEKRAAIALIGTGGALAASFLAGPMGGMAVSGLARAVDFKVQTVDASVRNPPPKDGEFDLHRTRIGGKLSDLVPNPDANRAPSSASSTSDAGRQYAESLLKNERE